MPNIRTGHDSSRSLHAVEVVYFDFDAAMTKQVLMNVINLLESNNLLVVATVSDLGPRIAVCIMLLLLVSKYRC